MSSKGAEPSTAPLGAPGDMGATAGLHMLDIHQHSVGGSALFPGTDGHSSCFLKREELQW